MRKPLRSLAGALFLALSTSSPWAQNGPVDLTELSLEELMNLEVTLASRKGETLLETAAAIEVLTADDLRRSGVTTIPEALRLVPGLEVARFDGNKWAISSRGFNNLFANKLLVLVDGRSAYSPMFSGVFWETQDLLFEDIERIEVIRGPGASLWGANAVNGIINIVTRHSRDTQGLFVKAGTGTVERKMGSLRIGGGLGKSVFARAYAKAFEREPFEYGAADRTPGRWETAADGWNVLRGGFRIDGGSGRDAFTLQGDVYDGDVGQTMFIPVFHLRLKNYSTRIWGGNLLGRVKRSFSEASEATLQLLVDRVQRDENVILGGGYRTFDADFQHRLRIRNRHELLWGAGYRVTSDRLDSTDLIQFRPQARTLELWSAFVQDEIELPGNRFRLTLGSKFEHNDFTGFEFQPNVRMLMRLDRRHSAWWAVSRAMRTPSRADRDIRVTAIGMVGSPDYGSEELIAYEFGTHHQPSEKFFADVSCFFNSYRNLQSFENDTVANKKSSHTYGLEASVRWRPKPWFKVRSGAAFLRMRTMPYPDSMDLTAAAVDEESPGFQAFIQSSIDLPGNAGADLVARFVDALPSRSINAGRYIAVDARLAWSPFKGFEVALVCQNLNLRRHREFGGWWIPFEPTQVPRSAYVTMSWKVGKRADG